MQDLAGDEAAVLFFSVGAAMYASVRWVALLTPAPRGRRPATRATLVLTPVACAGLLLLVLRRLAAREVVDDWRFLLLFECLGLASIGGVVAVAPFLGISARHDAIERGNVAAVVAIVGAMLGQALAFAGANVGEGATIWTTIGPAALATAALLLAWAAIERVGYTSEWITIDRDFASGVRLAAALIGVGAILGRAASGDYVSAYATLHDFVARVWPAFALAIVAAGADRVLHPTPRVPRPGVVARGVVPAIIYLGFAGAIACR